MLIVITDVAQPTMQIAPKVLHNVRFSSKNLFPTNTPKNNRYIILVFLLELELKLPATIVG